jgi:hypothetical protein
VALRRALAGVHYSDGDASAAEVICSEAAETTRSYGAHEDLGLALNRRASALVDFVRNAPETYGDQVAVGRTGRGRLGISRPMLLISVGRRGSSWPDC